MNVDEMLSTPIREFAATPAGWVPTSIPKNLLDKPFGEATQEDLRVLIDADRAVAEALKESAAAGSAVVDALTREDADSLAHLPPEVGNPLLERVNAAARQLAVLGDPSVTILGGEVLLRQTERRASK